MSDLNRNVKRVFLAGVGMVTEACDCTKEKLDELARNGEKFLDEQSEKTKKWFDEMVKKGSEVMGDDSAPNEPLHREKDDVSEKIKTMSAEELAKLKQEIEKAEAEREHAAD